MRRNATQSLPPVAVTVLGSGTMQWLGAREDRVILRCGVPLVPLVLSENTSLVTPPAGACPAYWQCLHVSMQLPVSEQFDAASALCKAVQAGACCGCADVC